MPAHRRSSSAIAVDPGIHGLFPVGESVLRWGLVVRLAISLLLQSVLVGATLGLIRRARRRLAVQAYLLAWHAIGSPQGWGLERPS